MGKTDVSCRIHTGTASMTKSTSESASMSVVVLIRARVAVDSSFDKRCFATSFSKSLSIHCHDSVSSLW